MTSTNQLSVSHLQLASKFPRPAVATSHPLVQFIESFPLSSHLDAEPPRKRARLDNDEHRSIQTVTLDERILHLHVPSDYESSSSPSTVHRSEAKAHCYLHEITKGRRPHHYTLILEGKPGNAASRITIHCAETSPGIDGFDFLDKAVRRAGKPSRGKVNNPKAIWAECILEPSGDDESTFFLEVRIVLALRTPWTQHQKQFQTILEEYLPDSLPSSHDRWSPQDFYENVHLPDATQSVPVGVQSPYVDCELYPFQKRAVSWLLQREGVTVNERNEIVPLPQRGSDVSLAFQERKDHHGEPYFVSPLLGAAFEKPFELGRVDGGILSEEMGLGKTVELISLICLHKRAASTSTTIYDLYTEAHVKPSPGTLIITPPVILEQWKSELAEHAPSLKVYHYKGLKHSKLKESELVEKFLKSDVVITTFNVLASEIHYTKQSSDRALRNVKIYEARRSPLVQLSWWRVCLDEAQMIESGVSNAAKVARIIPRCNAWAVTGTPLRKDINDLLGLMIFLRLEPFCQVQTWDRLISSHKAELAQLCSRVALRHTKAKIREELRLPLQKRVVITIPFTAIEEQYYTEAFDQMCAAVGVDQEGGPLGEDWDPESTTTVERMRSWLTRLRQMCLHPEVGGKNRRALGNRSGPLRTVDEVLEVMIDNNETAIRVEERTMLMAKATRGHIISFGKETQRALDIYLDILKHANEAVADCREQLEAERSKIASNKSIQDKSRADEGSDTEDDENSDGKQSRLGVLRMRLRGALELQHNGAFFSATGYFQLKDQLTGGNGGKDDKEATEQESAEFRELEQKEVELYDQAKKVRRELLSEVLKKTSRLIEQVTTAQEKSLASLPRVAAEETLPGIESRRVMDKFDHARRSLNYQREKIEEWKNLLVASLCKRLLDQEDGELELTGEEYEQSTKLQDEQYVYLEVLRYAIADRDTWISGQHNALVKHESAEAYKTATRGRAISEAETQMGPAPELMKPMLEERMKWVQKDDESTLSLRGIVSELRGLVNTLNVQATSRSLAEASILEQEMRRVQAMMDEQAKAQIRFNEYYDTFRSLMNSRLEFYKQLQRISDMVAPYQDETSDGVDETKVAAQMQEEQRHSDKLAGLLTKRRFLIHLRDESAGKQEQRICVICQSTFEIGILVVCGHVYCKECFRLWFNEHRNCPMCRRHLKQQDFHEITYAPRDMKVEEEQHTNAQEESASPTSESKPSIYTQINTRTLDEIKNIDLNGSYGSKIDTIVRHILWIRSNDPGAKSIIFSQYRDFLIVLGRALAHWKISSVSISEKNSITSFKEDPSIECFLLHAKADSSGLNLVNATHVLLCEPLINVAIELQAIARVHRIGQRRETTVWMYLVNNTVEESIYDISVSRRLQHIQKRSNNAGAKHSRSATPAPDEEIALDAVNSLELQSAPIRNLLTAGVHGGEIVRQDDLWTCLFGKARGQRTAALNEVSHEVTRNLAASAAEQRRLQANLRR